MSTTNFLILKKDTQYITEDMSVRQAMEKFDFHKFSVVPIIKNNGEYITTVSEGDILRYIKNIHNFNVKTAEKTSIMVIKKYRQYASVKIDAKFEDVLSLSIEQNFVPIVDDRNMYIGIIRRSDILDYYFSKAKIN